MRKIIFILILLVSSATLLKAQMTAVDFTLKACDSSVISLYNLLNQKKIVILNYEHLCFPCTQGADSIKTVINKYYKDSTNIMVIYLDNNGNSCKEVQQWIDDSSFIQGPIIQYANDLSTPYGDGMPVIVITAGLSHKIFMRKLAPGGDDTLSIHLAIKAAYAEIASSGITDNPEAPSFFNIYPNPLKSGNLIVNSDIFLSGDAKIDVLDVSGKQLLKFSFPHLIKDPSGLEIPLTDLENGVYFLRITSGLISGTKKFIISR